MSKPTVLEIALATEAYLLQIGQEKHEVKPLRLSSFFDFLETVEVIQKPAADLRTKFDASVRMLLLCVPSLKRETLDLLAFDDFQKVVDFVMGIALAHSEKAGLKHPFLSKPSPSGDTSESGSETSAISDPVTSGS